MLFKNNCYIEKEDCFNETKPYLKNLNYLNEKGFSTFSSQPGHDLSHYDKNEHSYLYGYGYISGYVKLNDYKLLNEIISLSVKYLVIIQNVVIYQGRVQRFNQIPKYVIGNQTGNDLKVETPLFLHTHTFPAMYQNHYYVLIQAVKIGLSNIFEDVVNAIH